MKVFLFILLFGPAGVQVEKVPVIAQYPGGPWETCYEMMARSRVSMQVPPPESAAVVMVCGTKLQNGGFFPTE